MVVLTDSKKRNCYKKLCATILWQAVRDRDEKFCFGESKMVKEYRQFLCDFVGIPDIAESKEVKQFFEDKKRRKVKIV